jgi:hypothetical protein
MPNGANICYLKPTILIDDSLHQTSTFWAVNISKLDLHLIELNIWQYSTK